MGRRDLGAPRLCSLSSLRQGDRDRELSSLVVKAKGSRRENGYELTVPGSVLELLFNLIPVVEVRTLWMKEVKRYA